MKDTHQRYFISVAVFVTAISTGLSDGLIGPALPSLAELASSTATEMTIIYTWRSCFAIAGSLIIGHMLDRFDASWVLAIALFFQAVFASIAPWLKHIMAISAVSGLSAFFNGGINAGTYSLMFRLYGRKAGPLVQGVRMCYIGGLALAPVVAEPFIIDSITDSNLNDTVTQPNETESTTFLPTQETVDYGSFRTNRVQFAFIIVALTLILWSMLFAVLGCCGLFKSVCPRGSTAQANKLQTTEVILVVMTLLMTFVYGGMDVGFGGLLFTYVTDYMFWSNREGVLLTSVFQIVKIVVVAVTIAVAMCLHPKWLVGVDVVLLVGTSVLMVVMAGTGQKVAMWVCTVLLGIGLANLHASNMSWLGKRVAVTGKVSALFNVAFSGGIMAIPPLTGLALEDLGLRGVPTVVCTCSAVCLIMFILLFLVNTKFPPHNTPPVTERQSSTTTPIVKKGPINDPVV